MTTNLRCKFKKQEFPERMINKNLSKDHRDTLFNFSHEESHQPKEFSMSDSFIREDSGVSKSKYNPNKSHWKNQTKSNYYPTNKEYAMLKGNKTVELEKTLENNFMVENSYLNLNERSVLMNERSKLQSGNESDCSSVFTEKVRQELDQIALKAAVQPSNSSFIGRRDNLSSFTPVNIKALYRMCEKLKYHRDDPLFYLYHEVSKSSFGPISSSHLEELYSIKSIDGQSSVRFIDIFKLRNKGPFAYFKLKEIENVNFLRDNIEPSNLFRFVEELNKLKKEECAKVEILNKQNKKEKSTFEIVEKKRKTSLSSNQLPLTEIGEKKERIANAPKIPFISALVSKPSPVPIKSSPSVIDQQILSEKREKEQTVTKKTSKKRGKPVDLEIKTGFYTLSQQEKNYEPIYICGDKEEN